MEMVSTQQIETSSAIDTSPAQYDVLWVPPPGAGQVRFAQPPFSSKLNPAPMKPFKRPLLIHLS